MNRLLDGSCGDAAIALGLSPLATLALRVSLMILRRIPFGNADRSLKVSISSTSLSIRVSRPRRSGSRRNREIECMAEAGFISTATTPLETAPPVEDASSYLEMLGNGSRP